MSNNFYVYLLLDPRKAYLPFYVGKGKNYRAYHHLKSKAHANCNPLKAAVIDKIRTRGLEPKIMIWKQDISEAEAFELEMNLIQKFGRRDTQTGILTNMSNGGEGNAGRRFSEEHRQKLSEAAKGRKMSQEAKDKISQSRKGRLASNEAKRKMSEAKKGENTGSENHMFGRKGDQHPNYGKEGLKGEKNGMFGRRHSPESIEKMRQKARQRQRDLRSIPPGPEY